MNSFKCTEKSRMVQNQMGARGRLQVAHRAWREQCLHSSWLEQVACAAYSRLGTCSRGWGAQRDGQLRMNAAGWLPPRGHSTTTRSGAAASALAHAHCGIRLKPALDLEPVGDELLGGTEELVGRWLDGQAVLQALGPRALEGVACRVWAEQPAVQSRPHLLDGAEVQVLVELGALGGQQAQCGAQVLLQRGTAARLAGRQAVLLADCRAPGAGAAAGQQGRGRQREAPGAGEGRHSSGRWGGPAPARLVAGARHGALGRVVLLLPLGCRRAGESSR